jgi:hypothetical protein
VLRDIHFSIHGDDQYVRSFEVYEGEAADMSDPLNDCADHLISVIGEQFDTEGERTGHKWAELDRAYAVWKARHFPGKPILQATGVMHDLMTSKELTVTVTPDRMTYEVDLDRAIWHQEGKGHNPQRKIVDMGAVDRREWDHIFASWLNGLRHRTFGR